MTRHIRHEAGAQRMDCDAFEGLLADHLKGDLRPALRAAAERHQAECARCAALAAGLVDLRHAAAHLPAIEPARDLWAGIEARIAAPVVALPVAPALAGRDPRLARTAAWLRGPWAAAAALLLVAGMGGAAYLASRDAGPATPAIAAAPAAPAPAAAPAAVRPSRDADVVREVPTPAPAPRLVASAGRPARAAATATASPRPPAAAPLSPLDAEIATLRRTLAARRAQLDTATVRALEANLAILDGAIRESRAALVEEPTSQLLHEQLNQALGSKLELMRTAVILSGDD